MADGSAQSRRWAPGYNLCLSHGVGEDRHLRAECRACQRVAVFDPSRWMAQGLGGTRLSYFETRLRCVCGARQASLYVWSGPAPEPAPGVEAPPQIYSYL